MFSGRFISLHDNCRFEKQMELEQKAFEEQKIRIHTEFAGDKERLLKEIQVKEQELEMQREKSLKDKKDTCEQLNREFNEKVRLLEKRNKVNWNWRMCVHLETEPHQSISKSHCFLIEC